MRFPRAKGHAAEPQDARRVSSSRAVSSTAVAAQHISSAQTRRADPLGGSSSSSDRTVVPGLTRAMELVPGPSREPARGPGMRGESWELANRRGGKGWYLWWMYRGSILYLGSISQSCRFASYHLERNTSDQLRVAGSQLQVRDDELQITKHKLQSIKHKT
jgi:hypothetical protein